jgi:hypothetical protein
MSSRERGNIWPVISVAAGAFFVLVITPLILHRQKSARLATVDPQVTIGDAGSDSLAGRNAPMYRWPDSEVPRTAERLRDATAIAIASITQVAEGEMLGYPRQDVDEIVAAIALHKLIPEEWRTNEPGVLQTPHGTVHIRYSPPTATIEVISVPNDRKDGPAILIRIPDSENIGVGPRYFESTQLDGIVYPSPFAPVAEIIASGWQPRLFKQAQIPDDQRAQLEEWLKATINK